MTTTLGNQLPDSVTDKPPRPRRWIPLSIRLFAALLVLLGISSILWVAIPAYREHRAIQEVRRLGGHYQSEQTAPKWLCNLVGYNRLGVFEKVTAIYLRNAPATDDSLKHFDSLAGLRVLDLDRTQVTDVGLVHLKGLMRLEYLDLHGTGVTDTGLAQLTRLTELRTLCLSNTGVTDVGLAELTRFSKLQRVTLGPDVTDAGLGYLSGLRQLRTLWLVRTEVTLEGIKTLKTALPACAISH
jgi:hypothetical protein